MTENTVAAAMRNRMPGRVAIVTGAAGSLGQAIARRFAAEGAKLVLDDLRAPQALAAELMAAGTQVLAIEGDASNEADTARMAERAIATFGRIDVLVNVAGINSQGGFDSVDLDIWEKVLRTNLTSAFLCCKAVVPAMREQRYGRIVNISSVLGKNGGNPRPWIDRSEQKGGGNVAYGASKAGLHALTFYLAKELAVDGVTVNAVAPGPIATAMTINLPQTLKDLIPMGRMGQPDDVADAVAYLAGDSAGWVTGEVLDVNGGLWTD